MKKQLLFVLPLLFISFFSISQSTGIGTTAPDASAVLDLTHVSKGLLIPRMSTTALHAIPNPARGLLVFDSTANTLMVNTGTPALPTWTAVVAPNNAWKLAGNNNTNPADNFLGTTDNRPLRFRVNNRPAGELHPVTGNVSLGLGAGISSNGGFSNVAIGSGALQLNPLAPNTVAIGDSALYNNGTLLLVPGDGEHNTAVGSKSLFTNNSGSGNTGAGYHSLMNNTDGSFNVAAGAFSLLLNTTGRFNTAVGFQALRANTTANLNTALGYQSLSRNTTGFANTAAGTQTLFSNTTGIDNTAIGYAALNESTTADSNTAIGRSALIFNTTGDANTATGTGALFSNRTGNYNTGLGINTLVQTTASSNNTAIGANAGLAVNLGSGNTLVGAEADATIAGITNSVAVGAGALVTGSNQVRLGNFATTSIGGQVGFSSLSDGRYKKNVREMVHGIDFIMQLRPVTYQLDLPGLYRKLNAGGKMPAEGDQAVYSGFIAQEVEKAAAAAGYTFSGVDKPKNPSDPYGLRYSDFVVPLVKAVQEQQKLIGQLQKEIENLKRANTR
jgi:trimeric autotransporter adhesin